MALQEDLINYKAQVNNEVSTQVDPNSIPPEAVGGIGIDLADILLPYLLKINKLRFTGGTVFPTGGDPDDVYFRSLLNKIDIYRNVNGIWQLGGSIPLGISYPDGILIGLRTSIQDYIVTVSPGTWAINNTTYSKTTQTQLTISPKDLNYGRWDLIYADNANQVNLITGVASTTPVKPELPANSILVDYVYVPYIGLPFLLSGSMNADLPNGLQKTALLVDDGSISINWQEDIVPNGTMTYVEKHGADIASIKGYYDSEGTVYNYTPNYTYTKNPDNSINIVTITEIFAGTLIIL